MPLPAALDPLRLRARDARQVAQLDAFFRGTRAAGPVGVAAWSWHGVIGRPGAIAFELGAAATHRHPDRLPSVKAFATTFAASIFGREPEGFYVVETTAAELPFPLPIDPAGFVHHAVEHRGRRYYVDNVVTGTRMFVVGKKIVENVFVLEQAKPDEPSRIRGFLHRRATNTRAPLTPKEVNALAKRGPFTAHATTIRKLVAGGVPKDIAHALWSGESIGGRGAFGDIDWERAVVLADAAAGDDRAALWEAPREKGGPVDRVLAAYAESADIDARIAALVAQDFGDLSTRPAKKRVVRASDDVSKAAKAALAAAVGLPASEPLRTLAEEAQQIRWDRGMTAFGRVLRSATEGLAEAEAGALLDAVYEHHEHSHLGSSLAQDTEARWPSRHRGGARWLGASTTAADRAFRPARCSRVRSR